MRKDLILSISLSVIIIIVIIFFLLFSYYTPPIKGVLTRSCDVSGDIYDFFGVLSGFLGVIIAIITFIVAFIPIVYYIFNKDSIKLAIEVVKDEITDEIQEELHDYLTETNKNKFDNILSGINHKIESEIRDMKTNQDTRDKVLRHALSGKLDKQIDTIKPMVTDNIHRLFNEHSQKFLDTQDKLRFLSVSMLFDLYEKRADAILSDNSGITQFHALQSAHLKDMLIMRQLCLPDEKNIWTALNVLKSNINLLPEETLFEILCILDKQGRLPLHGDARQVAKEILREFNKDFEDCEKK